MTKNLKDLLSEVFEETQKVDKYKVSVSIWLSKKKVTLRDKKKVTLGTHDDAPRQIDALSFD